jgi:carbamoyl-phosphate synthase large subunit
VLPFNKFPTAQVMLGPEMRSTGEVMGIDADYGMAFAKAQAAAGTILPTAGRIFISICDRDKELFLPIAKKLRELGFDLVATRGTHRYLLAQGVENEVLSKISVGRPNILDLMANHEVGWSSTRFRAPAPAMTKTKSAPSPSSARCR